ncbi:MAG: UMP kinase [Clostridia bacterium]|nr:UMP kinase [Clostridia bacterium]MBR2927180.1 UMP kinase [Clostridia bacterium]
MKQPKYKRILLKLSGEALSSGEAGILDFPFIETVAQQVKRCVDAGVQVAVIVGAGNIWRGRQGTGMEQCRADHMGMLATTINALALQDVFLRVGLNASVMTAVEIKAFADTYTARDAIKELEGGSVVIFGAGLGIPYFSTDTAAALRAAEIHADCILMAKNIDAIYSADPKKDPSAVRYEEITYRQIIEQNLRALDMTATILCMDNNIESYAFGLANPENIYKAVMGEAVGTAIHN